MAAKKSESKPEATQAKESAIPKDERIGYHKGSLAVLDKERQELSRILGIVEQIMQMHAAALKELGVAAPQEQQSPAGPSKPKAKPPIEDII